MKIEIIQIKGDRYFKAYLIKRGFIPKSLTEFYEEHSGLFNFGGKSKVDRYKKRLEWFLRIQTNSDESRSKPHFLILQPKFTIPDRKRLTKERFKKFIREDRIGKNILEGLEVVHFTDIRTDCFVSDTLEVEDEFFYNLIDNSPEILFEDCEENDWKVLKIIYLLMCP